MRKVAPVTMPTIGFVAWCIVCFAGFTRASDKPPGSAIALPTEPIAKTVAEKIDLLDRVREGRMEYFINPKADVHDDAESVFRFDEDGLLHVSGRGYGGMTTLDGFKNYRLVVEFKWGEKTWGSREHLARDSGILVHCRGPQGTVSGNWMAGFEAQIIEGGVGDILVLSPTLPDGASLVCSLIAEAVSNSKNKPVWSPGVGRRTMTSGRLNWQYRAADWKDVKGFRGENDVESPYGEWTRVEIVADGTTLRCFINDVKVNEAFECKPSQGRILLQVEAAEMFVRRYELYPLDNLERK